MAYCVCTVVSYAVGRSYFSSSDCSKAAYATPARESRGEVKPRLEFVLGCIINFGVTCEVGHSLFSNSRTLAKAMR